MSDEDLELLENYLDGALAPDEAERVCRRLERDRAWAGALDTLRAQRAARRGVWQSFEPDVAFADLAGRAAVAAALRAERSLRTTRFIRRASGVAAGLLIAFAGGWAARGRVAAPATPSAASSPAEFQVALTDEGGKIIAVQHFSDPQQARQFAEDVGRWQSHRRQEGPVDFSGDFSQVSDEF